MIKYNKLKNIKKSSSILMIYILFLLFFVVLKLNSPIIWSTREHIIENRLLGYWNFNLIPFKTIKNMFIDNNYLNILGNILPFLPLGFLISISYTETSIIKSTLKCIIIIIFFEIIQFFSCLGFFDIDDILLNTFSCFLGIILYIYIYRIRKSSK